VRTAHYGVVRAEEARGDLYAAIDVCCNKLHRSLRKVKEKAVSKGNWPGRGSARGARPPHRLPVSGALYTLHGFHDLCIQPIAHSPLRTRAQKRMSSIGPIPRVPLAASGGRRSLSQSMTTPRRRGKHRGPRDDGRGVGQRQRRIPLRRPERSGGTDGR
jgi:Sigma 54 modulation protein / S30EA ribosomal protein